MLEQVQNLREKHRSKYAPERSALLVLDMQRFFLEESSHAFIPSAKTISRRIKHLIEAFKSRHRPVIFTRHINSPGNSGRMAKWWQDLITAESPLSHIVPELDSRAGLVIEKTQYDAFYGTQLEEALKEQGVGQVVICGVMTHLCCETTARSAFVRGFEVLFTIDGTATYNKGFHGATLLNLAHGFAYPVLVEEILAAFGRRDDS
ncbi:MAG: hypothetical protein A2Z21_04815 [Candidatus Fraserbacteria bacterium RBG_16_55_9]|uniref:Isochorismatase-like domain-containing protein n=1 Tax=Fraserbacteria sp. (strain RBG_16_55_9) TaxID=1817864 RepID=A0A1F5UYE3_FRAXR|nr:MAG: hypothetical protein A2Z21_04815 [Candidatus Fraserbacteria bacterium RBG_16_55_9]